MFIGTAESSFSMTSELTNVSGGHTTVVSMLPLPFNRMIGAPVYPHLD
jgi:hypothetical protein